MGLLHYAGRPVEFDDRLLAHLHVVIVNKLRRGEGFTMSWVNATAIGGGRTSIWLDRSIPLEFTFAGSRPPAINADWLQTLRESADSSSGLVVTGEDGRLARIGSH